MEHILNYIPDFFAVSGAITLGSIINNLRHRANPVINKFKEDEKGIVEYTIPDQKRKEWAVNYLKIDRLLPTLNFKNSMIENDKILCKPTEKVYMYLDGKKNCLIVSKNLSYMTDTVYRKKVNGKYFAFFGCIGFYILYHDLDEHMKRLD